MSLSSSSSTPPRLSLCSSSLSRIHSTPETDLGLISSTHSQHIRPPMALQLGFLLPQPSPTSPPLLHHPPLLPQTTFTSRSSGESSLHLSLLPSLRPTQSLLSDSPLPPFPPSPPTVLPRIRRPSPPRPLHRHASRVRRRSRHRLPQLSQSKEVLPLLDGRWRRRRNQQQGCSGADSEGTRDGGWEG